MTSPSQVPIPALSSRTLRWKRVVCWAAFYSASCTIAANVGPMLCESKRVGVRLPLSAYVVSTVPTSIFWLPCSWVCFRLRGEGSRKSALALAVGMGGVQFFLFGVVRSAAHAWDEKWWIQGLLLSALLAQPLMAGAAIRVYYSLPSERRDRLKLLASCSYALVLLFLLAEQIPSNSYVAGPIPRNQSAVVQRMWKINQASADYADKFGGVYPFDLAALETRGPRQQSDCRASGLLDRGFDEKKYGYRIEYKAGSRSDSATVGCAGSKTYAITARPTVLGRTGLQNFFSDESGVMRATREDRTATASDRSPQFSTHLTIVSPSHVRASAPSSMAITTFGGTRVLRVLWRFRATALENAESRAARVAGALLFALAAPVAITSVMSLLGYSEPKPSFLGIAILIAAAAVMPCLAKEKHRLSGATGSAH